MIHPENNSDSGTKTFVYTYEKDQYRCARCLRSYKAKKSVIRHFRLECGKQPKYQCPYCTYKSTYHFYLKKHIHRMHINSLAPIDPSLAPSYQI